MGWPRHIPPPPLPCAHPLQPPHTLPVCFDPRGGGGEGRRRGEREGEGHGHTSTKPPLGMEQPHSGGSEEETGRGGGEPADPRGASRRYASGRREREEREEGGRRLQDPSRLSRPYGVWPTGRDPMAHGPMGYGTRDVHSASALVSSTPSLSYMLYFYDTMRYGGAAKPELNERQTTHPRRGVRRSRKSQVTNHKTQNTKP